MRARSGLPSLCLLFLLSGACGLTYQLLWMRLPRAPSTSAASTTTCGASPTSHCASTMEYHPSQPADQPPVDLGGVRGDVRPLVRP